MFVFDLFITRSGTFSPFVYYYVFFFSRNPNPARVLVTYVYTLKGVVLYIAAAVLLLRYSFRVQKKSDERVADDRFGLNKPTRIGKKEIFIRAVR